MTPQDEARMIELACDGALLGFSNDGRAELEALLGGPLDGRALDFEVAAAAVQMADFNGVGRALSPRAAEAAFASAMEVFGARGATRMMPAHDTAPPPSNALMRGSLAALGGGAGNVVALRPPGEGAAARPAKRRGDVARWAGWMAAAACLGIAAASWLARPSGPVAGAAPIASSVASDREAFLTSTPDVTRTAWTAATDPTGKGVAGEVVWSTAKQRGYMRFTGLAANDPKALVYQLWIFDGTRDERFPVDGGVFDVDAATGDVIVPIAAKLRVEKATLFAVTIEKPGGVVVSKRDRLVVTAAVKPA